MAKKKAKAPVHSAEHMLREQSVAPVWLPQINEQWKHGVYEHSVRLPGVDLRQPLAKTEGATDATQERYSPTSNAKLPFSFTSSRSRPPPPPANVNLPSAIHDCDTKQEHPVTRATRSQFSHSTSTRGNGGHVRLSSRKHELVVTRTLSSHSSRGSRGQINPRHAVMKQAKLRYEQEKLAIQQQDQQKPVDLINVDSENSPSEFGRASPVAGMTRTQPINLSPQHGFPQQPGRPTSGQRRFQTSDNSTRFQGLRPATGRNRLTYPRPLPLAPRLNSAPHYQSQLNGPVVRRQDGWSSWIELRVKIFGIPATVTVTTLDLWHSFSKEGSIDAIEIFEDSKGTREGKALIRYR